MMKRLLLSFAVMLAAIIGSAQVSSALLINGGFETGKFNGWAREGKTNLVVTASSPIAPYEGLDFARVYVNII